jgi:hypothetical protein
MPHTLSAGEGRGRRDATGPGPVRLVPVGVALGLTLGALLGTPAPAAASHVVSDDSLRGSVAMPAVVAGPGGPHVRVEVRRPDGRPASDLAVQVEAFHGFLGRASVVLRPDGPGVYAGRVPVDGSEGLWQGVVRVEGGPRRLIADIAFTVRRDLEADVAATPRPLGFRKGGPWTPRPWLDHLVWGGVLGGLVLLAAGLAGRPWPTARSGPRLAVPLWVTGFGITGAFAGALGAYWDVAWHVDRGRETFWSPPHLLIYGGILSVVLFVLFAVALQPGDIRRRALEHRGLRFTLGAGVATLASAPFDEAWHALFGLDVSIWSPPHLLLLFGSGLSMLGLALIQLDRQDPAARARRLRKVPVTLLAGASLLIVSIFVLEFEFTLLERWHVMLGRPRGLYPACGTALTLLVLGSAAWVGGPGAASAAAAVGWLGRVGVSLVFLPSLGRTAPLLPPFYLIPALGLDLALALTPAGWSLGRRFAVAGSVATVLAYLAHNPVAGLVAARTVPPAELWGWFPVGLAAGAAAAVVGARIGTFARPGPAGAP